MAGTYPLGSRRILTLPGAGAAACLVAIAALVVAFNHAVRLHETEMAAAVVRLTGGHGVHTLGSNVLFFAKHRYVGFALDAGCSAAFLVAPFFLLGAGLLLTGRVSVRRAIASTAVAVALVFAANQARLAVIAFAIRGWGLERGYERSHVFLGTVVSTVGVLIGVLLFVYFAGHASRSRPGRGSGRGEAARQPAPEGRDG